MAEKTRTATPLRAVVWDCGLKALLGLLAAAVAIAVIGWIVEKNAIPRSWDWLLWAASAGGKSTWFGLGGTFASMGLLGWGACVYAKTAGDLPKTLMVFGGFVCAAVYIVFLCATLSTFDRLSDLSAYAICGVIAAHAPIAIIVLGFYGFLLEAAFDALTLKQ